jgi:hypothetical protein
MKRILRSTLLAGGLLACSAAMGLDAAPAQAQMVPPPVQPGGYTYSRGYKYYNPGMPQRFAPRGGIGQTPYLGNARGLGAYSYNYDRPSSRASSTYAARGRRYRWGR